MFYPFLGASDPGSSPFPYVDLVLVDHDGVVFDGMTSAPVDPPPLSSFESAALLFHSVSVGPGGSFVPVTLTANLTALLEPSLAWLALAPLLIAVTRGRAPEVGLGSPRGVSMESRTPRSHLVAAVVALALALAAAAPSRAMTLANGDVLWAFATADYHGSLTWTPGSASGTMSLSSQSTGRTITGVALPVASVTDGPAGSDLFLAQAGFSDVVFYPFLGFGLFGPSGTGSPSVELYLVDQDATAFSSTTAPANPPSLASFEQATLTFHYWDYAPGGSIEPRFFSQSLTALPEPSLVWLALAPLLLAVTRKRAPEG